MAALETCKCGAPRLCAAHQVITQLGLQSRCCIRHSDPRRATVMLRSAHRQPPTQHDPVVLEVYVVHHQQAHVGSGEAEGDHASSVAGLTPAGRCSRCSASAGMAVWHCICPALCERSHAASHSTAATYAPVRCHLSSITVSHSCIRGSGLLAVWLATADQTVQHCRGYMVICMCLTLRSGRQPAAAPHL